jgi:hypothetical protein
VRWQSAFALQSGAGGLRENRGALQRMHDLMVRGGAPTSVAEARNSSDVALLRLAMLAAVGLSFARALQPL